MRQDSVRVAMREAAWLRSLLREYFPAALVALSTEPETRTAVGDGLVELDREEVAQGRLRRYYRLTGVGRRALAAEAERQAANARAASERLRAPNYSAHILNCGW